MREVSGETGFIENLKTGAKKIIKKLPKGVAAQLTAGGITAGASLLQLYTSLIYKGPLIVKNIKKELIQILKSDGFNNIKEAIGKDFN